MYIVYYCMWKTHHVELFILCCRTNMGSGQSSKHNPEKKSGGYPEYGQHQPSGPPPDYPGHASSAPPMTQQQYSDRPPAYSSAPNNSLVGASGTISPDMKIAHLMISPLKNLKTSGENVRKLKNY